MGQSKLKKFSYLIFAVLAVFALIAVLLKWYGAGALHTVLKDGIFSRSAKSEFTSFATRLSGTNRLQFATLKQMERFERTSEAKIFWQKVNLPDVVVSAEAPVEYTYYLDLEKPWEFEIHNAPGVRVLKVVVPAIEFNTPAVTVSEIKYEVKKGSILRNEKRAMEELRGLISGVTAQRAADNIHLVREMGRKKTEEFVKGWLVTKYKDASEYIVKIEFKDEQRPDPASL